MLVSDYSYDLPEERIAKFPPEKRGETRLLVLDRKTGAMKDSWYKDLADFLNPGDVLILNDTKVMPARLIASLPDGRKRELVVLENHHEKVQKVMYRGKLHEGDRLRVLPSLHDAPEIKVQRILGGGIAEVECGIPLSVLAEKYGVVPLPPYLHREATASDTERYQTVWAKNVGSAAAPTASLNMTDELLDRLRAKGVKICYLTLHVGLGTFLPIRTDVIEDHKMHSEWYEIPEETLKAIAEVKGWSRKGTAEDFSGRFLKSNLKAEFTSVSNSELVSLAEPFFPERKVQLDSAVQNSENRGRNGRIVAVGTTVARTLEFYAKTGQASGEDDIFIYPGFQFRLVDALLTNFHAPKSTVLMLASAFAGWENLRRAYDYAVKAKYNFLSYGDSMLITDDLGGEDQDAANSLGDKNQDAENSVPDGLAGGQDNNLAGDQDAKI